MSNSVVLHLTLSNDAASVNIDATDSDGNRIHFPDTYQDESGTHPFPRQIPNTDAYIQQVVQFYILELESRGLTVRAVITGPP